MAIPRSLKLIRLLKKAWSTLKQSNARRNKNQKNRATSSLPSVLSQIQKLDTIYVETAADMEVVQKLINAQEPWKGTHIVVKTKQDATTATIKQKAKELELEVIESDDWDDTKKNQMGCHPRLYMVTCQWEWQVYLFQIRRLGSPAVESMGSDRVGDCVANTWRVFVYVV